MDVLVNLQQAAKTTDQIEGGAIQEGDGDLGEIDDQEVAEGGKAEGDRGSVPQHQQGHLQHQH